MLQMKSFSSRAERVLSKRNLSFFEGFVFAPDNIRELSNGTMLGELLVSCPLPRMVP